MLILIFRLQYLYLYSNVYIYTDIYIFTYIYIYTYVDISLFIISFCVYMMRLGFLGFRSQGWGISVHVLFVAL